MDHDLLEAWMRPAIAAVVAWGPVEEISATYVGRAVPTDKHGIYKTHAAEAATVFKENGALRVVECWGDDVPEGKLTSFPMAVKREPNETVVFSWIEWPDKATRDKGMDKVKAAPRLLPERTPMPFDGKRMISGGFSTLLDV